MRIDGSLVGSANGDRCGGQVVDWPGWQVVGEDGSAVEIDQDTIVALHAHDQVGHRRGGRNREASTIVGSDIFIVWVGPVTVGGCRPLAIRVAVAERRRA